MAFRCGFYNAVNHDRTYNATQFGDLFTGLINDGVYATVGHAMTVAPVSGMTVKVRSGRAWFNKTWNVNDSDYPLSIPVSDLLLSRIDAVILEIDSRLGVRNNSLKVVRGEPANNPSYPNLIRANGLYQYPLAYVTVKANARNITASDIEVVVGRSPTPFVTGIVESADISDFWEQWDSQFHEWFDELRTNMSGDVAAELQAQIEELKSTMITTSNKATEQQAKAGVSNVVWMTPLRTADFFNYRLATNSEATGASNNTHIMTPLRVNDFFKSKMWDGGGISSSDIVSSSELAEYLVKCAATDSEVSAGKIDNKYVSPKTLKTALADYSPSEETPSGTTGSGTVISQNDNSVVDYEVRYCKQGSLTVMHYSIGFTVSNSATFTGLTITGLPVPTQQFDDNGVFRKTTNYPAFDSQKSQMYRLMGTAAGNNISVVIEIHGSGDATFSSSYTYYISGNVVYY